MSEQIDQLVRDICLQLGHDPDAPPVYIVPPELSKVTDTKTETLSHWRVTGRYNIPFVKVGSKVLYPIRGAAEFLSRRTITNTGQKITS